ncbi:alpha-L-arabinofuranosidase [Bifidobacterium sp. UTCIF-37]|uniref:alpha-N-arabinofuranosidase n=1 Tax=unclassified Bifidobacterium TaxID=2608897 RepID=UPI001126EA1E|nr:MULTISPECIES: alpha-L-arabinofuranosidase C-terminal domain-containing protein [unclassified Bifidobacterium]TPF85676.1 alpha-L-arabinofuranosidase [Bifidobacterium sp. UTCIF-37]TPF88063.1 alpha-L-arabinofuranosidase [Bifidobacterium sp. UTCIF-38]
MGDTTIGSLRRVADVPERLFGSFVEHLGRCVYGGIYEPGHPSADEDGFREDVLDLVRELGVTCVRYPGGNFVSNYNWEDGTGPREQRPVRRDLAWHQTETNEIGIDDFHRWSLKAGTEIMLAVNMGTRGLKAALDELEYVNGAPGTELADRRVANGIPEPMDVKMWCIGNEMDGPWQVGHMTPDEYADAVEKTAHAMKLAESGLELVACGSSSAHMPTFGTWERTVLTRAYQYLDFVSAHAYYFDHGHKTRSQGQMQEFLAAAEDMTTFIDTVAACADEAREANHGDRDIALSFDEWGVWYSDAWNEQEAAWKAAAGEGLHHEPWPKAPHLLEDVYSAADAVVEGSLMITLLKHCDRVRSASRAQLVNVIAPIMAEPNGPAWRQTTFYPFAEAAHHAKGDAYAPQIDSPLIHTEAYGDVKAVDAVVTWNRESREGLVLIVNRDASHAHDVSIDLGSLPGVAGEASEAKAEGEIGVACVKVTHAEILHDDDIYRTNTAAEPDAVTPQPLDVTANGAVIDVDLPQVSWVAIRFTA